MQPDKGLEMTVALRETDAGKAYRGIFVHWQRLISSINKKDNYVG